MLFVRSNTHGGDTDGYGQVDRRLDLVVGELKRYGVSQSDIQEAKWYGKDMWPASDGYACGILVGLFQLLVTQQ